MLQNAIMELNGEQSKVVILNRRYNKANILKILDGAVDVKSIYTVPLDTIKKVLETPINSDKILGDIVTLKRLGLQKCVDLC